MADVLLHNTLVDQADAQKAASTAIDFTNTLGKTLKAYLKEIIDANTTTGSPYYVASSGGGGGNLCDLSNVQYISTCACNYSGSGTSATANCNLNNPWNDGSILGAAGVAEKTKAEIRAFFVGSLDTAGTLKLMYDANNTDVEDNIYFQYLGLRHDYYAANNTTVLENWYNEEQAGASTEKPGKRLSETNYVKICDSNWKYGAGPASQTWTVPAGAICAKFQVWGAGIGTNGACCCGGNQFGANGAYSEAVMKVTPGDSYTVCAGCSCQRYCCSNSTPGEGCMSGVTGPGICCLAADGYRCYNGNCYAMNEMRQSSGFVGGQCRRVQNPYCTQSGPCWCSYSEYCFDNSCSTCGVVPVYPSCGMSNYCSCITTACEISGKSGPTRGHYSIHGGVCLDTNNYGFHMRPPIIDSDTGAPWPQSCGCNCQSFSSGSCCGGCAGRNWYTHPGHGGAGTHVMGGNTNHFGDTGRSGMVQISWITS